MSSVSIVKPVGPATYTEPDNALTAFHGGLPSIERMKERMAYQKEMRKMLVEYVKSEMNPALHFYTIPGSTKPALSQDGARMLCTLYEVHAEETLFSEETEPEGHYTVRATVRLRSMATGAVVAEGTGRCSTHESKYAYRWLYDNEVPGSVRKADCDKRKRGNSWQYKVPNPDLADTYNTVLKMAEKRGQTAAVLRLPCAPDVFSEPGAAEEEREQDETADRKELMGLLVKWTRTLPAGTKNLAFKAVTGAPYDKITELSLGQLDEAYGLAQQASAGGIEWKSKTLMADLAQLQAASATQAQEELYGDGTGANATMPDPLKNLQGSSKVPRTTPSQGIETVDTQESNLGDTTDLQTDLRESQAWHILRHHQADQRLPNALIAEIRSALRPDSGIPEPEVDQLASTILDCLDADQEEREQ